MSKCFLFLLLLALPCMAQAQTPEQPDGAAPFNAPTLAVLLANKPERFTDAQWLEMMREPVNRSLYPLWITQAMLDSLDGRLLDRRFNYIMGR